PIPQAVPPPMANEVATSGHLISVESKIASIANLGNDFLYFSHSLITSAPASFNRLLRSSASLIGGILAAIGTKAFLNLLKSLPSERRSAICFGESLLTSKLVVMT